MSASFRTRLAIAHVFVVLATLAIAGLLLVRSERRDLQRRRIGELTSSAHALAAELPASADWDSVADAMGVLTASRVTLMDRAGVVIGDSEVPRARLAQIENHSHRPEMRTALAGGTGQAVRHSHTVGHDLVYVAVPARVPGGPEVLRVAAPLAELARIERSFVLALLGAAGLALLLGAPLVMWIAGWESRRVRALDRVALRMAAGEASARAIEGSDDELGRLGRSLNHLARESSARYDSLLRERDQRERILAHLSNGVALIDGHGRVQHMNRSFAALLGRPLPAEPGTPLQEYARVPELDQLIRTARAEGRASESDLRLWSPASHLIRAIATPLDDGEIGGVLVLLTDLSESERLARMRQDFVANVSHELRTPLTSLRGYAETLLDGGLEDLEHREGFVRVIRDQAVRLEHLTRDLLSLAELERPDARARRESFDLRALMEQQIAWFRPRAEHARLALELAPGEPLAVVADRALIEQALANLLDNALKYTERGAVMVRGGIENGVAWCEVADTGSGIPPEHHSRIFERFYRVDKARSRAEGGTGLGLSIVKHVMALHGGEVTVRSEFGAGSTFRLEFPARESA